MDKDQEKIASGEQGDAATCGTSPGPGCWAIGVLLEREEQTDSRRIVVTRRLMVTSVHASSHEEAVGAATLSFLRENSGFSLANLVSAKVDMPNPSLQGAGHLVDRTLQGVVQIQESPK